jgi:lysophospholipid acyltransferase
MKILELRENLAESLSKVIGAPANQLSLIITMLSVIPFCFLNYLIHGKKTRLIYSLVLGFLFQISIYQYNSIHILISAIFTYIFIEYFGRKYSAYYVFIFSLLYLSYLHIKRIFVDYGEWRVDDPTTIYMMSICKFSSLAFSYEDGSKELKDMKNAHHREYRIVEKPTLLEVLSFIYFYPTSIIGPSIEFKDFINFINEKDCYSDLKKHFSYIFVEGLKYFVYSFLAMAAYAIISNKFPVEAVVEKDFGKHSLIYTLVYIKICIPGVRAKYYSGWILSYATVIFSGLSYTEKEKNGKIEKSLEKGSYGTVKTCEWSINSKDTINEWNKTIHVWLKYNVYTRVINIEKKPFKDNFALASFLTFICSAIWHGYYLTYYLTFFLLYCYQSACVVLDKLKVYDWIYKREYIKPFATIFNCLAFETIGIIFFNLEWNKAVIGLKNMRYYPIIVNVGLFIITDFLKVPKTNKEKKIDKSIEEKVKEKKIE